MPVGEMRELSIIIFSSIILFHTEKQRCCAPKGFFLARGEDGEWGAAVLLCRYFSSFSSFIILFLSSTETVVADISIGCF